MIFKQQIKNIFIFIIFVSVVYFILHTSIGITFAEEEITSNSLIVEEYTATDEFLSSDNSNLVYITDFAQTVINSNSTTNLSDLTKVIPVEYLRTTGEEKIYSYNGLEYGFYVRHRAVTPMNIYGGTPFDPVYVLDILLINFTYEPTADIKEFKIRIEPLFSETFLYSNTNGIEKWTRITGAYNLGSVHGSPDLYQDYRAKLWIKNPRFATYLLNENDKNVGDVGYNSLDDDGLIIEQSRVNYSGYREVSKNNPDAMIETGLNVFTGIVGLATGTFVSSALANMITAIDLTKSFALSTSIYFSNQIENVECNNETNIISALGDYKDDPYHARAMLVEPVDELAFKAGDSYAENIIRVNENNSRTRITQICMFDIVSSLNLNAIDGECLNEIDEDGNSIPFAFGRQGTYFNEAGIEDIPTESYEIDVPYYLLNGSNQVYEFWPVATGNYNIISEKPISIYYNNEKLNTNNFNCNVNLTQGLRYKIVVESEQASESSFTITFAPPKLTIGNSTLTFNGEMDKYYILDEKYEYYNVETSDENLLIRIKNVDKEIIQTGTQNIRVDSENQLKYILFTYVAPTTQTVNVTCQTEKEINFVSSDITVPSQTIINGAISSLPIPTREGFIFNGWYLSSIYTGFAITAEQVMQVQSPTVTLYAKWTIDNDYTFSISYVALMADGTDVDNDYVEWPNKDEDYTTEESVTLPTLESLKYELVGWYYDADFTQVCTTWAVPVGSYGHKTFYAKLTLKEYIVAFNAGDGSSCVDIKATYLETIILPTSNNPNHIGTWGAWGARKENGEYPTNFGGTYVVEGNVTFVAQWKKAYTINYMNLDYGGYKGVVRYNGNLSAPKYFVVGEEVDISKITADIIRPTYYDNSPIVFMGWYTNMNFIEPVDEIEADQTGEVTLYARWQYNYYWFLFEEERKVTDSSEMDQAAIPLPLSQLECDNLLNLGITQLTIGLYINMWEVDDGYQEILIYGDETDDILLWSDTAIEHGPGKKLTSASVHVFNVRIDIQTLKEENVSWLYVRFGANGNRDDDWKYNEVFFEIYATTQNAVVKRDTYYKECNPLG